MTRRKRPSSPLPTLAPAPKRRASEQIQPNEPNNVFAISDIFASLAAQCRDLRLQASQLASKINVPQSLNLDHDRQNERVGANSGKLYRISRLAKADETPMNNSAPSILVPEAMTGLTEVGAIEPKKGRSERPKKPDEASTTSDIAGKWAPQNSTAQSRSSLSRRAPQGANSPYSDHPLPAIPPSSSKDPRFWTPVVLAAESVPKEGAQTIFKEKPGSLRGNAAQQDLNFWKDSSKIVFDPNPFAANTDSHSRPPTTIDRWAGANVVTQPPDYQSQVQLQPQFPPHDASVSSDRSPTPSHDLLAQLEATVPVHAMLNPNDLTSTHHRYIPSTKPPPPSQTPEAFIHSAFDMTWGASEPGPPLSMDHNIQRKNPAQTTVYPHHPEDSPSLLPPPPAPMPVSNAATTSRHFQQGIDAAAAFMASAPPNGYHKIRLKHWDMMPAAPSSVDMPQLQPQASQSNSNSADPSLAPKAKVAIPRQGSNPLPVSASTDRGHLASDAHAWKLVDGQDWQNKAASDLSAAAAALRGDGGGGGKAGGGLLVGGKFRNLTQEGFGRYSVGGRFVSENEKGRGK